MTNATKLALEESLKHLLLKKPLDKITINDLTTDCGISRMTFYYHFKDIYDLVEWCCLEDARIALQGKKTSSNWHEGLLQIFDAVMENKPFILNVYRCVGREQIENYLFQLLCTRETKSAVHEIHLIVYNDKSFHKYLTFSCAGRFSPSFR